VAKVLVKVLKRVKAIKVKKLALAAVFVSVSKAVKCLFTVVCLKSVSITLFTSEVVTRESLVEKGFLSGKNKSLPIKVLAKGEFSKALTFKGIEKFSAKAQELISKAGGKIVNE
jgi:ribosomal protein L15